METGDLFSPFWGLNDGAMPPILFWFYLLFTEDAHFLFSVREFEGFMYIVIIRLKIGVGDARLK